MKPKKLKRDLMTYKRRNRWGAFVVEFMTVDYSDPTPCGNGWGMKSETFTFTREIDADEKIKSFLFKTRI